MDLYQKLSRIGKTAIYSMDNHVQTSTLVGIQKEDVLIGISYSGETKCVLESCRIAKEAGAFVIGVSQLGKTSLSKLADDMDKKGLKIKMPDSVPYAVSKSFENLFPTAIVMLLIGCITYWIGFDWHTFMQKKIRQTVQEVFAKQTVYLMSDIDLAVLGTLEGQDGITVILGTGSVVLKKEEGNVKCYGGWGYLLGDEGSGYAIGLKALQTFVKQADGRMAKDELYQEIMWLYDMQMPSEIIAKTIKDGRIDRTDIAAIAKIVCEDACPSCHAILCEAAKEAAALILTAYTGNERVVITGGMAHAASYMKILKDTLQEKNCSIEKAVHDPVYGGYVYWKQCSEKK